MIVLPTCIFRFANNYELERVAVDGQNIHRHTGRHKDIDTLIHRQRETHTHERETDTQRKGGGEMGELFSYVFVRFALLFAQSTA